MPGVKRTPGKGRRMPLKYTKKANATKTFVRKYVNSTKQVKSYGASYTLPAGAGGVTSSGQLQTFSDVSIGTADTQRVGDMITYQRWAGRYSFAPGTAGDQTMIRMIWFQWHPDTTLAAPTVATVMESANYNVPTNFDRRQQFTVLKDVMFGLDTTKRTHGTYDLAPSRKKAQYFEGANTGSNHLYLLTISDGATPFPRLDFVSSVTYYD